MVRDLYGECGAAVPRAAVLPRLSPGTDLGGTITTTPHYRIEVVRAHLVGPNDGPGSSKDLLAPLLVIDWQHQVLQLVRKLLGASNSIEAYHNSTIKHRVA